MQPLSPADSGELLTLQRASYVSEAQIYRDPSIPPLTQTHDELLAELRDSAVIALGIRTTAGRLAAAVRFRLVGSAATHAPDGATAVGLPELAVSRLIVAPDLQRRGLGTALLRAVEDAAPLTVRRLTLFTGSRSEVNLRLYRKFGYRETHRVPVPARQGIEGYEFVHLAKELRASDPADLRTSEVTAAREETLGRHAAPNPRVPVSGQISRLE